MSVNRRGMANFGALKQNPICKQSRGGLYFDKTKWNIPSDGTKNKKSQETESWIRRVLQQRGLFRAGKMGTNEMRKSDSRAEDLG